MYNVVTSIKLQTSNLTFGLVFGFKSNSSCPERAKTSRQLSLYRIFCS